MMAKKIEQYKYPSRFGSHESMIASAPLTQEERESWKEGEVICEDEFGRYKTRRNRLDDGLADPARYASRRLFKLYEKSTDKKKA